jgi:aldehyde:ferredoxin oxidoreductase
MAKRLYGTTGKILRVDLTNERVWEESVSKEVLLKYLGGTSLGVKFLYDEVNPGLEWSNPDNIIYVGSGPLGGTRIAGSGSFSVVTKGAMTNGTASTQANGFFGAYLKFSGFDGVLIQGAASEWKYLYIHDGTAELRDAEHLLDQDTWNTEDVIKKELGYKRKGMSVCSIGPAGENMVRFAGLFTDSGHSASHNGVGAVFGSKKLKAIAVSKSDKKLEVADSVEFAKVAGNMLQEFKKALGGDIYNYGTSNVIIGAAKSGMLQVKNYTTNIFPEVEKFYTRDQFETQRHPCWACPSHHVMHTKVTEGPYEGFFGKDPEYEQSAGYGPQIGNTDPGAMVVLANEGDRLGFDANEATWIIGWLMECYEKGLVKSSEIDGLEMTWGNVEAVRTLMKNIAYRRGFGDVLAEGIKRAAENVGGEALNMAIYTYKGNTPRGHDHRCKWWEMVDTCISESGTLQNQLLMLNMPDYGLKSTFEQHSWEDISVAIGKTTGNLAFVDSLVLCFFTCQGNIPLLARALNAATGWDLSFKEAFKVGRRAINLMRVYNVRCGLTPDLERPSTRYGSTPVDGPAKGLSITSHWENIRSNYYRLMGWDEEAGLPLPETLKELGLEYVINHSD